MYAASFIVTKDNVLWLPGVNQHRLILKANMLQNADWIPNFLKVEITPPNQDYSAPLSKWIFKINRDVFPEWHDIADEERRVRLALPDWYQSHIAGQITDAKGISQKAGDYSTQKAGDDSTQKAGDYSTQKAGDYSTQKAGDDSIQAAGDDSIQAAGYGSTQAAGDYSTQKAGDYSTQTAGKGTVQIIRWHDDSKWIVFTRVITKRTANKPYKFENGKWKEVK